MNRRTTISLLRVWLPVLLLLALAGLRFYFQKNSGAPGSAAPAPKEVNGGKRQALPPAAAGVPAYALEVLEYVRANDRAPQGYVGGRTFENRERRLPRQTPAGASIRYREWDVHPQEKGRNRGPERLVTGSDRSAWFTADHYRTFIPIE